MRHRLPSLQATLDRLAVTVRMLGFLGGVALFAGLGWLDAGVRRLWPAWREREAFPRWASEGITSVALWVFPRILAIPCARPQVRVRRLVHPETLSPGAGALVKLTVQNWSGEVWRGGASHPFRLGVIEPWRGSAFYVAGQWLGPMRPAQLPDDAEIAPLETASFRVPIRAPSRPGRYREVWGLVIEGRNWIPTLRGIEIRIDVRKA